METQQMKGWLPTSVFGTQGVPADPELLFG